MRIGLLVVISVFAMGRCFAQSAPLIEESAHAAETLGYSSVSEALAALKSKPNAQISVTQPDGWTIVNEPPPNFAVWSFTPQGHPAHPAVVRRTTRQAPDGMLKVEMVALCQAAKEPCDQLIRDFQQLNEQMRQRIQSQRR